MPAFSGMKLPDKRAGGKKRGSPVTAVKPDAKIAFKPKKTPAVLGSKFSTRGVLRPKTGPALITTRPAVVNPCGGGSATAALTAPAARRSQSFPQRNTRSLQKDKSLPSVVVKKGDSVSGLLFDAYGRVDEEMLRSFKNLNPQIKDINKISAGERIFLPTEASYKRVIYLRDEK